MGDKEVQVEGEKKENSVGVEVNASGSVDTTTADSKAQEQAKEEISTNGADTGVSAAEKKKKKKKKKKANKTQNQSDSPATALDNTNSEGSTTSSSSSEGSSVSSLITSNRVLSVEDAGKAIINLLAQWREATKPELLVKLSNTDQLLASFARDNQGKIEALFAPDSPFVEQLLNTPGSKLPPHGNGEPRATPAGPATSRAVSSCYDILLLECAPWVKLDVNTLSPQILRDRGPLAELMATLDARKMLANIIETSYRLRFTNRQYPSKMSGYFIKRTGTILAIGKSYKVGEEVIKQKPLKKYPNEVKDVLQHLVKPVAEGRLPDILPPDDALVKMSAKEITTKLALYTGEKSTDILARLRPSQESETGFIAANEDIGDIILADIKQLQAIGVTRHQVADRLEMITKLANVHFFITWIEHLNKQLKSPQRDEQLKEVERLKANAEEELKILIPSTHPWKVIMHQFIGFQTDPFHPTLDNPTKENGRDYYVANTHLARQLKVIKSIQNAEVDSNNKPKWPANVTLFFSSISISLIRRVGFFEGSVKYRVDPIHACKVLGLHPDNKWDPIKQK